MKKIMLISAFALLMAAGCGNKPETEKITVGSQTASCVGVAPMECLLVKYPGAQTWEFLYSGIEGFDYKPGYEYVLEIRREAVENPPADASSVKLVLVKEISRERKNSEGLPEGISPY